jgi:hypothetical protein
VNLLHQFESIRRGDDIKKQQPIKFEAVCDAGPVDKVLWDQHLEMIAEWVLKECIEAEKREVALAGEKGKDKFSPRPPISLKTSAG